jgi:hypothetical protein
MSHELDSDRSMPAKKQSDKQHPKSAKAAEEKFGKSARKAAETGGKKPVIWQKAEQPQKRLPGSVPLAPTIDPFEPPVKTFEASVARTIEASASDIFRAFNDPNRRGWCHERGYAVRGSVAPRSLTLGIVDGTFANVAITRKGNTRCVISVVQKGFPDADRAERARNDWRGSLDRLAGLMAE